MTLTSSQNHWWQNWSKTHAYVAGTMFFPTSVGEVVDAVRTAEADRRPLRAVGGGWSFSDASLPGTVTTNRPNVYAVDALSKVVPQAIDPSQPGLTSILGTSAGMDVAASMEMLREQPGVAATVDPEWLYTGNGQWTWGGAVHPQDDGFLNWLGAGGLRPVRALMGVCLTEADSAGSLVMHDLNGSPQRLRDWFYRGGGIWTIGCFGGAHAQGSLLDLSRAGRLTSTSQPPLALSPRASTAANTLALLLSKQATIPAAPEPVCLLNTRALNASLQQQLPGLLCATATDATSPAPASGAAQRFLFHVEAGITIAELGQLLSHQSPHLSLQAISGSPGATLAGALATATHGAEFNWPLLIDTVKAVHLVGPGGVQWWIEGDEPITDEAAIRARYGPIQWIGGAAPRQGVQPHDWLGAAVVSMGCLGVVYSVVLEVVPRFGVHEIVVEKSWGSTASTAAIVRDLFVGTEPALAGRDLSMLLRDPSTSPMVSSRIVANLLDGAANGTGIPRLSGGVAVNQYADLAINPNRRPDGAFDCWIGNRELTSTVPLDPHPSGDVGIASMLNGIQDGLRSVQNVEFKLASTYALGNVIAALQGRILVPSDITALPSEIVSGVTDKASKIMQAGDLVDVGLDTFLGPLESSPFGFELGQAMLSGILAGLLGTANCARRSDKTGVSVGALGFPESGVMGTALEIAMAPADAFGFVQTEILDRVVGTPFLGYVSVRLCKPTTSLMGMQQFSEPANPCSVMIEIVAFDTAAGRQFMADLQQRTVDRIATGLNAMLHWGLENDRLTAAHLATIPALQALSRSGQPKLDTFKTVRARVHAVAPAAFRVFDNAFTARLGLDTRSGLVFCDQNKNPLAQWTPRRPFGVALAQDTPARVDDFALLNPGPVVVDVTDLRFVTDQVAPNGGPVFTLISPTHFQVDPGQLYWVATEYHGAPAGPLTGSVDIDSNDPVSPTVSLPLATDIVPVAAAGELHLDTAPVDFATVRVGATVSRNLLLQNTGQTTVTLELVEVTEPLAAQFVVTAPSHLDAGRSDQLTVSYTPTTMGAAAVLLRITTTSTAATLVHRRTIDIAMTGEGIAPRIFLAHGPARIQRFPVRERELKLLDFGVAPPATSVPGSFWVRNQGTAPLIFTGPTGGTNFFGAFSVIDPAGTVLPFTVAPGAEREVACTLQTSPFPGGSVTSALVMRSDDPFRPSVELTGSGRSSGPHLTEPAEFHAEVLRVDTGPATLVFRSDGTDPVLVRAVEVQPNTEFEFTVTPTLPANLPPGSVLTLTVNGLHPGQQAQLTVLHNGTGRTLPRSQINVFS